MSESTNRPMPAEKDALTGLNAPETFFRDGEKLIADPSKAREYAVIYLDILKLKAINDIFGSEEGDRLLRFVADLLNDCTPLDMPVRLLNDKFAILLHGQTNPERWVRQFLEKLSRYDLPFAVICNLGIYLLQEEKVTLPQCLDRAVLAQSTVKGNYVQKYAFYTEDMRQRLLTEQEIAGMFVNALQTGQFVPYLQPQFDHLTGKMIGAEALARWKHPVNGLVSPSNFIPVLEKTGMITQLDLYIFEEVCKLQRGCLNQGITIVPISVNFSRHGIFHVRFVEQLEEIREKYDVPAQYIPIEITESVCVVDSRVINELVRKLNSKGYPVEMDDFGSGYSSLNLLKDIEFNMIKLDMGFLETAVSSLRSQKILRAMVQMANSLEVPVIAEGVETMEQADFLNSIDCNLMQGYLYSRPIPKERFAVMLKDPV